MRDPLFNKYRAAVEVLQRGRDLLVESLADEILDQGDDLTDTSFQFNEFLESQGTRLHFLGLLVSQLEQSAEALDEILTAPPPKPPIKRKSRAKKIAQQSSKEGSSSSTDES